MFLRKGNVLAGFAGSCVEQEISTGKVNCEEALFSGIFSSATSARAKDINKAAENFSKRSNRLINQVKI